MTKQNRFLVSLAILGLSAIACLAAATLFSGCEKQEKEEKQKISVTDDSSLTQEVFADNVQGSSNVSFTTTGAWTSRISTVSPDAKSAPLKSVTDSDWIAISPDHGASAGSYTVEISLETNTTGEDRTGIITIACEGEEIEITITQKGVNEEETGLPSAVTNFVATAGNEMVYISWNFPLNDGGSEIIGFEITMDNWKNIIFRAVKEMEFTFTGLTNDIEYAFKVRALNANGTGEESVRHATPIAIGPPSAVTNFIATAGNTIVTLSWDAPLDDGGSNIIRYEVTRNNWTDIVHRASYELEYPFTGLTNGVEYTFKVRAVNANGTGEESVRYATPTAGASQEWVMINGVKWATCNVDAYRTFAAAPELAGMLYQWNRSKAWPTEGDVSGWNSSIPGGTTWSENNDPSPNGFRVPTKEEMQKLIDREKVDIASESVNGNGGVRFTDKATGNSIFIPRPYNCRLGDGSLSLFIEAGMCWSSTGYETNTEYAYGLRPHVNFLWDLTWHTKNRGNYVRPVVK